MEEAKNMAKFDNHPNIVSVFDFFEENNTAYFVMEFLEGTDYKHYIEQQGGKVSLEYALEVTKVVLHALSEVHKHGIVHRDISPDNVFLCSDGRIKLIDFGTARFSSKEEEILRSVEVKWEYAPPEQYQKKSKQGPWTDVYAVGAMLYKAITNTELQSSQDRVEEDHLVEPKKLCPELSENLNNTILRAMALQPELRFQTTEAFLEALEAKGKIRSANKELKYRKKRRIVSIAVISALIGISTFICYKVMNQRKADAAILSDVGITVWIPGDDKDNRLAYENALEEFKRDYPQVDLDISFLNEENYEYLLKEAFAKNELPTLFDSTCLDCRDMVQVDSVSDVFKFVDTKDYCFLGQYKNYFSQEKQIPLGFMVPVVYRNQTMDMESSITELVEAGDFLLMKEDYFSYTNVFGKEIGVSDFKNMPDREGETFELQKCENAVEHFMENEASCLIGDISANNTIESVMAGYYSVEILPGEKTVGRFVDCFSINADATKDEKAAAVQVLVYLLSDAAQDVRYVQSGYALPIKKSVLNTFIDVNTAYSGLQNKLDGMLMPGEYQKRADELVDSILQ